MTVHIRAHIIKEAPKHRMTNAAVKQVENRIPKMKASEKTTMMGALGYWSKKRGVHGRWRPMMAQNLIVRSLRRLVFVLYHAWRS